MDIFEKRNPFNIFSLHLNKKECTEVQAQSYEIIKLLEGKDWLSESETAALEMAQNSLRGSKAVEPTIDDHLRKFLN